jgi:hypothetical protein
MDRRFENYFVKALHDAKIEELSETYSQRGFVTEKDFRINGQEVDLWVHDKNTGKTIVFEVKLLPLTQNTLDSIHELKDHVESLGHAFRLVTIAKPARYEIEIDWFYNELLTYVRENPPPAIEEKATHVFYEAVDADVESIVIEGTNATVHAVGTISVNLQYGSDVDLDSDQGLAFFYTFPFEGKFDLVLTTQSIIQAEMRIDDSSWSE